MKPESGLKKRKPVKEFLSDRGCGLLISIPGGCTEIVKLLKHEIRFIPQSGDLI
ncbi:hypothetical protein ACP2W0_13865 [Pseudobacillus badius]|uniref:hypothetical protein n=1 Tax=Bacillus badius TaxID=1455 RepID=UPI003CEA949F